MSNTSNYTRRRFLRCGGAAATAGLFHLPFMAKAATAKPLSLIAGTAQSDLLGAAYGETAIWAYNASVPGPEIRVRQGERIRVLAKNRLNEETTIHWHGIRTPNAMDGVPHLTQTPIPKGGDRPE